MGLEPGKDGVSALERALKKSVGEARAKLGRNAMTSFLIVDAQSVKNVSARPTPWLTGLGSRG